MCFKLCVRLCLCVYVIFPKSLSDFRFAADVLFKKDMLDFFTAFNAFMSKPSPKFIGAQTMALRVCIYY